MAKFGLNRTEKYGGQGGGGFFALRRRNTAHIRFLYNNASDVEGYSVHEVDINGKKRYVDCLCGENDNETVCPFCSAGIRPVVKFLVPVYDEDTGEVLTWDRGKTFGGRLEKLFSKCEAGEPLSGTCFEVTKEISVEGYPYYTIEPMYSDGTTLEELPDYSRNVYGTLVLLKTAEEMRSYLKYGDFYGEDIA